MKDNKVKNLKIRAGVKGFFNSSIKAVLIVGIGCIGRCNIPIEDLTVVDCMVLGGFSLISLSLIGFNGAQKAMEDYQKTQDKQQEEKTYTKK